MLTYFGVFPSNYVSVNVHKNLRQYMICIFLCSSLLLYIQFYIVFPTCYIVHIFLYHLIYFIVFHNTRHIQSSAVGHLGCLHMFGIIHNVMNIVTHTTIFSFCSLFLSSEFSNSEFM